MRFPDSIPAVDGHEQRETALTEERTRSTSARPPERPARRPSVSSHHRGWSRGGAVSQRSTRPGRPLAVPARRHPPCHRHRCSTGAENRHPAELPGRPARRAPDRRPLCVHIAGKPPDTWVEHQPALGRHPAQHRSVWGSALRVPAPPQRPAHGWSLLVLRAARSAPSAATTRRAASAHARQT